MPTRRSWFLGAAACLVAAGLHAQGMTVGGVRFDDGIELHGQRLVLNGAGVRYVAVLRYYAAALYLPRKTDDPDQVLAMPGAKRLVVVALREIDSADLGKRFTRGVEDNMDKSEFARLIPGLLRMSQLFSDIKKLQPGDSFTVDWVPGSGTVISVKGVQQGEPFREPEFFSALLRIWLGRVPADWKLKDQLLGKPS